MRVRSFDPAPPGAIRESVWLAGRVVLKAIAYALPIPLHFRIAGRMGRQGAPSEDARRNIYSVFESERDLESVEEIAWDYYRFARGSYLAWILPQLRGFGRPGRWPVQGIQYLDEALGKGRGVILLTAHYGYPNLIPSILELYGYKVMRLVADPTTTMYDAEAWMRDPGALKRYIFNRTRFYSAAVGSHEIVASLDVRPLFAALANNGILLIAGDGLRATEFERFQVLGKDHPFPKGFVEVALLTNAVVLPVIAYPDQEARTVRTEIRPPMVFDPSVGVEANLSKYVSMLNEVLVQAPQFWHRWGHANYFEEVWRYVEDDQRDPFTSHPAWRRNGPA